MDEHEEIHEAIAAKCVRVVEAYVAGGGRLCSGSFGTSCYAEAYRAGGWSFLMRLFDLQPEAARKAVGIHGESLLMMVHFNAQFQHLLNSGVDPFIVSKKYGTCLICALKKHIADYRLVCDLLKRGVDVNVRDEYSKSALSYSLQEDSRVVERLLLSGADPHIADHDGNTTIVLLLKGAVDFASNSFLEKLDLLLEKRVNVNAKNKLGENALNLALASYRSGANCFACLQKLVRAVDVHAQDENGNNMLMLAQDYLYGGRMHDPQFYECVVENLLQRSDLNCVNNDGDNAFTIFVSKGFCDNSNNNSQSVFKVLLERCNVNVINRKGDNAIMMLAKRRGAVSAMKLLLRKCDLRFKTNKGENALMVLVGYMREEYAVELLRQVVDAGVDPREADRDGRTVLHHSMEHCKGDAWTADMLSFLLSVGASPTAQDSQGVNFLMKFAEFAQVVSYSSIFFKCLSDVSAEELLMENSNCCNILCILMLRLNEIEVVDEDGGLRLNRFIEQATLASIAQVVFKKAATVVNGIYKFKCKPSMHPSYLLLKFLCRNRLIADELLPLLETVFLSPFRLPTVVYETIEYTYNAVHVVLKHLLQKSMDPTIILGRMLEAGYKVTNEYFSPMILETPITFETTYAPELSPLTMIIGKIYDESFGLGTDFLVNLVRVLIQHGVNVHQRSASWNRAAVEHWTVPDALYLATVMGAAEMVDVLLPYWRAPAALLWLVVKIDRLSCDSLRKLYSVLERYGPLPYGCEQLERISCHLRGTAVHEDFLAAHTHRPRTLKDYARNAVRMSLGCPLSPDDLVRRVADLQASSGRTLSASLEDYLLFRCNL